MDHKRLDLMIKRLKIYMHTYITDRSLIIIHLIGIRETMRGQGLGELLSIREKLICAVHTSSVETF